ncbi:MAG: tetratricopeptide repeat protein [Gemmatimonadota bacterium]
MTEHRPAADEAMNRTMVLQAGYLSLVSWIFIALLVYRDHLTGWQGVFAAAGAIPFCWYLTRATRGISAIFAERMIGGILAAGNIKYQQGYSKQESLIARGRFDEAAESFEVHLLEFPDDIPARLRLATLHLRERNDPASAENELLSIRRRPHDRGTAMFVANHMVDLYRATGQTGKLMAELNRMIRDWPGTPMAEGAGKLLAELKKERG